MLPEVTSKLATVSDVTATAATASVSLPESIADRYDIIRLIGGGGMGRVFVAYDRSLKRNVAIKVLAPDLALNPAYSRQLLREARAAAQLDHAHIAAVHDVVDSDGAVCIVMEMLRGETLGSKLRRRPLTIQQLVRYARQVAAALRHAHARGIVHCDLTPANIFITEEDEVKVLDFGLARVTAGATRDVGDEVGASAALIARRPGTPGYMSPEQKAGLPLIAADRHLQLRRASCARCCAISRRRRRGPGRAQPRRTRFRCCCRLSTAPRRPMRMRAIRASRISTPRSQLFPPRRRRPKRWRTPRSAAGGVAGCRSSRSCSVFAIAMSVPAPIRRDGRRRAAAFVSASADPSMAYLAAGLTEMLTTELMASNAVVTARSPAVVANQKDAAAVAGELGAGVLLLGRVERQGSGLVTTLRVYRAATNGFGGDVSFTRRGDDLAGIRRALAATARAELVAAGLRVREPEQRQTDATEKLLPKSMTRFEEFAQARWYLDRADVATNVDYAMSILTRLAEEEPTFAMAHAALGEAAWKKWLATRDRSWSRCGAAARARGAAPVAAAA